MNAVLTIESEKNQIHMVEVFLLASNTNYHKPDDYEELKPLMIILPKFLSKTLQNVFISKDHNLTFLALFFENLSLFVNFR